MSLVAINTVIDLLGEHAYGCPDEDLAKFSKGIRQVQDGQYIGAIGMFKEIASNYTHDIIPIWNEKLEKIIDKLEVSIK